MLEEADNKGEQASPCNKEALMQEIQGAIWEVADKKEIAQVRSLSRHNPEKVASILYLYSTGNSQTRIVKKYGIDRETVISVLSDYTDHLGKFRDLSGKIAAKSYLNLSSLEEDLINSVREDLESGELKPTVRDLKEISISVSNAARQAFTARGEATQITEDRQVITQEDYDETIRAAKERIQKLKQAEVVEIDEDNN
jgi:hypothetical protein